MKVAEGYYQSLSEQEGRLAKDARVVIGAVIIRHKLCLSDEETIDRNRVKPYLQYFENCQATRYRLHLHRLDSSLFVEIRKRMGQSVFVVFQGAIMDAV